MEIVMTKKIKKTKKKKEIAPEWFKSEEAIERRKNRRK